jgi:hypothetical protein
MSALSPEARPQATIAALFDALASATLQPFPSQGVKLVAPTEQGVHIIYSPEDVVRHVGQTPRGRKGLRQRLLITCERSRPSHVTIGRATAPG